jgi:hypothetical protein
LFCVRPTQQQGTIRVGVVAERRNIWPGGWVWGCSSGDAVFDDIWWHANFLEVEIGSSLARMSVRAKVVFLRAIAHVVHRFVPPPAAQASDV